MNEWFKVTDRLPAPTETVLISGYFFQQKRYPYISPYPCRYTEDGWRKDNYDKGTLDPMPENLTILGWLPLPTVPVDWYE